MGKTDTTLYNEDSIQNLPPRDFVRLRPGVYCGSTEYSTQLVLECFSNSLDEYNIGHGTEITISTTKDSGGLEVLVADHGQGFLINQETSNGRTIFEDALATMNTSGKYSDDGVYSGTALGLNGIGLKLVTYLSKKLWARTERDGKWEKLTFKDGIFESRETGTSNSKESGTTICFQPDPQFFAHVEPNEQVLLNTFEDIAGLCPGLTIIYNNEVINHPEGIKYLLDKTIDQEKSDEIVQNPLLFSSSIGEFSIDCGLTYSTSVKSDIIPYVNYGLTDSGPHITTLKRNVTSCLNKWARENKVLKTKDKNLDGASLGEGLVLVVNLVGPNTSYDSQLKSKIVSNNFNSFINETFGQKFEYWLDSNPDDAKAIVERAIVAKKAAEAAKKAREKVRNNQGKKVQKNIVLPTSLTDCWTKDRSKAELFVCEGLSAGSGLIAARNSETQAVYAVRGKMLSVRKVKEDKIYKNKEINNLITALGLDVNPKTAKCKYDPAKLRYDKIIAAADADPDGQAIENLLFNILWYICPELILNGHVYSAVPPLFRITTKKNEYIYLRDEAALEEYKKNHPGQLVVNRMKGLGECSAEELSQCLLDNNTRNMVQLIVTDEEETEKIFSDLYGTRVAPRVAFLNEHSNDVAIDME